MKLDLHGVKHQDVTEKLDTFIWEAMQVNVDQVEIITGKSFEMQKIVKHCLSEYGLTSNDDFFSEGSVRFDL
jgi:DNA-nicking Smr family endonuclease|tara:strand:- start:950 stop:1165 length:216 start_codon:yes stop_codon:yes gene_type:complete